MMSQAEHDAEAERLAVERRRMVRVLAEHAVSKEEFVEFVELLGLEPELAELKERAAGNRTDVSPTVD